MLSRAVRRLSAQAGSAVQRSISTRTLSAQTKSRFSQLGVQQISHKFGAQWLKASSSPPFAARLYSSAEDSALARVLKAELSHEEDQYQPSESVKEGPPPPFKVEEKEGAAEIILRRSYNGEDIAIVAGVHSEDYPPPEPEDTEDPEEVPETPLTVRVSITRAPHKAPLDFDVCFENGMMSIVDVSLSPCPEDEDEDAAYHGPDYAMLDENLQQHFMEYLERRDINAELGDYIRELLDDKEQREYMRWLKNVSAFVSK
eukprot:jgi/Mesen1/10709/ME000090S10167